MNFKPELIILLLTSILMLVAERRILKEKYILFSPYTLAQFSFLYVYILPFTIYGNQNISNLIHNLSLIEIRNAFTYFQVFYYMFSLFSIISFYKIKSHVKEKIRLNYRISDVFILTSIIIFLFVVLIGDLIIVNFNPTLLFNKLINPRKYTYLKEGLGAFTVLVSFSKAMLLYLSIVYRKQKKTFVSALFIVFAILLNFLGGSKTSLIMALIYYILVVQKYRLGYNLIKIRKLLLYAAVLIFVTILSFKLMSTNKKESTMNTAITSVIGYSQEAYYSSKVINDFKWEYKHIQTVIEAMFLSPIPRKIFKSKGYYGLYKNYWQPYYQPNVVVYHTSTYGFLAEGYMLFSFLTPFIYAILFNLLFFNISKSFHTTDNIVTFFFILQLSTWIYFLIRTGLFMSTSLWTLTIYYFAAKLFFKIGSFFNK